MSLHTSHNTLIGGSALLFLLLSMIIAVLPAFEAERTPALAGIVPLTEEASQGRVTYIKEGCGYCHTQFVRDLPVDRPYGRGSVAGDYALEDPPMLGTQRTGPDLSNVGGRQPSQIWNLIHLYNPRAVVPTSVMPSYPWLFIEKDSAAKGDITVPVPPAFAPSNGNVVVAGPEAINLVRYLQSLKQAALE